MTKLDKTTPLIKKEDITEICKKINSENNTNNPTHSSWGCEINIGDCVTDGVEYIGQMLIECCMVICKF